MTSSQASLSPFVSFFRTPERPLRWAALGAFGAFMLWLIAQIVQDGAYPLAFVLMIITLFNLASFGIGRLSPLRWMSVGLSLMLLFVLYPIFYTLYISTTNTGLGHILTKETAIDRLERERFVPDGGQRFVWTAYQSSNGDFALWLVSSDGTGALARVDEWVESPQVGEAGIGGFDEDGIPTDISGYRRLERRETVTLLNQIGQISFGDPAAPVRITSLSDAQTTQQRYVYQPATDSILDQQTQIVYIARDGVFVSEDGTELRPGFFINVGLANFERFFSSAALRGPVVQIVLWNFTYAIGSVLLSFALGLFIAVLFNDLPGKKFIRALLIVPYPIPALVSILIWRNLLNPDFGALVQLQESLFGTTTNWLTDPTATRIALIFVNVWLSYPYFYIVSSGAIQSLPTEVLDAASVDGAGSWQRFTRITLPLLLRIVSPLLVASFAFNFNNFNLIYIFNEGNPPIAGSPIPAGHTDILISFVYKLAFNSAQADYGLAASISIVLFVFVALITWLQFRYTRVLEDETA